MCSYCLRHRLVDLQAAARCELGLCGCTENEKRLAKIGSLVN